MPARKPQTPPALIALVLGLFFLLYGHLNEGEGPFYVLGVVSCLIAGVLWLRRRNATRA